MAKVSGWWAVTAMAAALVMPGYAQTDAIRSGASPAEGSAGAAPAASSARTSTAAAGNGDSQIVFAVDTRERFAAFAERIRHELQPAGQYARLDEADRRTLATGVAEMEHLFDQYGTYYKMPAQDRAKAQADWNAINGILAQDPGNLMICGEVTPLGSHLRKTVCRTLAQLGYRRGQNPRMRVALMQLHTNTW